MMGVFINLMERILLQYRHMSLSFIYFILPFVCQFYLNKAVKMYIASWILFSVKNNIC